MSRQVHYPPKYKIKQGDIMSDYGRFYLSKRDLIRFRVIEDFREGKITRLEASVRLAVSERQISRLATKIRVGGLQALAHKNQGRAPKQKISIDIQRLYIDLYTKKYFDFNYSHALEWIHKNESIPLESRICYETFRVICRKSGVGKTKVRKPSKARIQRERAASQGAVLQMDGSPHEWHGSSKCTLVAIIDDATSRLPAAIFSDSETTWACINTLRQVVLTEGVPSVIITDQAGWAGGSNKRQGFSQFGRICDDLGISLIRTSTAEAKGRVERFFRTAQDRIIPELRFKGVNSRMDANRYLQQVFIPAWNEQFTVQPTSEVSRYKPLPANLMIEDVFCLKHSRQIGRDQTVHFEAKQYRILNREWGSLWKRDITIHESEDGTLRFFMGSQKLQHEQIRKPIKNWKSRSA
jgi:hypothetical protein